MARFEIFTLWHDLDAAAYGKTVTLEKTTGLILEATTEADALEKAARLGTFSGLGARITYLGAAAHPAT